MIINNSDVFLVQADVLVVLLATLVQAVNLVSTLISHHLFAPKLVETGEGIPCPVMTAIILMVTGAVVIVKFKLGGLALVVHLTQKTTVRKLYLKP